MAVLFLAAAPHECRFPIAGAGLNLMVCGACISEGSGPYCTSCRSRAYRPTPPLGLSPGQDNLPVPEQDTTPDLVEVFA